MHRALGPKKNNGMDSEMECEEKQQQHISIPSHTTRLSVVSLIRRGVLMKCPFTPSSQRKDK